MNRSYFWTSLLLPLYLIFFFFPFPVIFPSSNRGVKLDGIWGDSCLLIFLGIFSLQNSCNCFHFIFALSDEKLLQSISVRAIIGFLWCVWYSAAEIILSIQCYFYQRTKIFVISASCLCSFSAVSVVVPDLWRRLILLLKGIKSLV